MMNSYNKSNPMVEILSKNYFALKEKQKQYAKNIVKQNFIIAIVSIFGFICTLRLIILLAIPIYLIVSIWLLKEIIKSTPLAIVEELFNGDEYKVQNINNEKIFELLSIIMGGKGSLEITQGVLLIIFSIIITIIFMFIAYDLLTYLQSIIF